MAGSRRSLKRSQPKVRVGLPSKKKGKGKPEPVILPGTSDSLEWDVKASQNNNYKKFGLTCDLNFRSGRNKNLSSEALLASEKAGEEGGEGEEDEGRQGEQGSDSEPDEVRAALGKKRRHGPSKPLPRLTRMQKVYVGNLIAKHGDDTEAMSRDIKLNAMQHPPGALKLLLRRYELH